jgi:hypothetical protein
MVTCTDESITVIPKLIEGIGYTFDPLRGADWWACPFCNPSDRRDEGWRGSYDALRRHLGREHNLRVVDQSLELHVRPMFDSDGQVIRYEPNVGHAEVFCPV